MAIDVEKHRNIGPPSMAVDSNDPKQVRLEIILQLTISEWREEFENRGPRRKRRSVAEREEGKHSGCYILGTLSMTLFDILQTSHWKYLTLFGLLSPHSVIPVEDGLVAALLEDGVSAALAVGEEESSQCVAVEFNSNEEIEAIFAQCLR